MENHLEMTKTSKESIYGIRRDAEETDTIGENSRGKSILKEKQVFSRERSGRNCPERNLRILRMLLLMVHELQHVQRRV